jgi:hypothetical protein
MDILTASDQRHSPRSRKQGLASEPVNESGVATIGVPNPPRIAAFCISTFFGKFKKVLMLPVSFATVLSV